jgi:transcriptional regulator with XRE-family HTH domain
MNDKSGPVGNRPVRRRRTAVATAIGDRIRRIRVERGLSQEFVAGRADISTGWFLQIENGQVEPRFSHVVAIAGALGVDLAQLAGDGPIGQPTAPLRGRHSVAAPTFDLERLRQATQQPTTIDGLFLDQLESLIGGYWTAYHTTAPTLLLPAVAAHVGHLWPLADASLTGATAGRLRSLLADASCLAGWLSLRVGNRVASSLYWSLAETLAAEAGDHARRCFTLASRSSLYTTTLRGGGDGDTGLALAFLTAASDGAGITPIQQAWTLARRAEEHAVRGDQDSAERDLDGAADNVSQVHNQPHGYFAAWDAAQFAGYRGSCATLLGAPDAVDLLKDSLAGTDRTLISQRTSILANLGSVHARLSHVDEACAALVEALSIAGPANLAVSIERVKGVRVQLDRWSDTPAVCRLDDLIAGLI